MRICIYGAGATGGHFAVKLARAGHDVSVIARGPHLDAIRKAGLHLRVRDALLSANVAASDDPGAFGPQDAVIVATKATGLAPIAAGLAPLTGPQTLVVFPQNGMTWWYPLGLPDSRPKPPSLPIFDLAGSFLSVLRPEQIAGGIIYSANELEAPGIVLTNSPDHNRLEIGPIDGRVTPAIEAMRKALRDAGIVSPDVADIRNAVWSKLLNNMSGSALALATGSPSKETRDYAPLGIIYGRIVREGMAIAAAHGYPLSADPDAMLSRLLDHKPSLLQDYEQHRPMEIHEILLAPLAFARAANIETPALDAVAAIVSKLALDRGLMPAPDLTRTPLWTT